MKEVQNPGPQHLWPYQLRFPEQAISMDAELCTPLCNPCL